MNMQDVLEYAVEFMIMHFIFLDQQKKMEFMKPNLIIIKLCCHEI